MSSGSPLSSPAEAVSVSEAWERELQILDERLRAQGHVVKVVGAVPSEELVASFHPEAPARGLKSSGGSASS